MSFFNERYRLAAAVKSVFAQTLDDWELILIDDGSTDGSLEILAGIRDTRIRVVRDGRNKGLSSRLNEAAVLAQAPYFARMDADDIMHPDRLRRQVTLLDERPEVDVVGTAAYIMDDGYGLVGLRGTGVFEPSFEHALKPGFLIHPSVMGRTVWFLRHPYSEGYKQAEDHELWCRTCSTTTFWRLSEPLHYYIEKQTRRAGQYVVSGISDCRIYLRYASSLIGPARTAQLVGTSVLKAGCFCLLATCGLQWMATQRNRVPLTSSQAVEATCVLRSILEAPLPLVP